MSFVNILFPLNTSGAPQSAAVPPNSFQTSAPSPSSVDKSGLQKGSISHSLSLSSANECLAEGLDSLVSGDVNSSVLVAAVVSVCLSLLIALCMACRRWRKRGKGSLLSQAGGKGKNWNVGDILGRSKEGFRPLSTDERENMLEDDSDSEVGSQYFETF